MFSQEAHTSIFAAMVSTHRSTPALTLHTNYSSKVRGCKLASLLIASWERFQICVFDQSSYMYTHTHIHSHTPRGGGAIDRQGSVVLAGSPGRTADECSAMSVHPPLACELRVLCFLTRLLPSRGVGGGRTSAAQVARQWPCSENQTSKPICSCFLPNASLKLVQIPPILEH